MKHEDETILAHQTLIKDDKAGENNETHLEKQDFKSMMEEFNDRQTLFQSTDLISSFQVPQSPATHHSTVTLFARFLGLSTSVPRAHAV